MIHGCAGAAMHDQICSKGLSVFSGLFPVATGGSCQGFQACSFGAPVDAVQRLAAGRCCLLLLSPVA
jgi:hypothetical protein